MDPGITTTRVPGTGSLPVIESQTPINGGFGTHEEVTSQEEAREIRTDAGFPAVHQGQGEGRPETQQVVTNDPYGIHNQGVTRSCRPRDTTRGKSKKTQTKREKGNKENKTPINPLGYSSMKRNICTPPLINLSCTRSTFPSLTPPQPPYVVYLKERTIF